MKTSKKLIFWATLIMCLGIFVGCTSKESGARQRITEITNIEVPSNSTMVYHHEGDGFVGRHSQYTVFSFEEKPIEFLSENDFQEDKKDDFEKSYDDAFRVYHNIKKANYIPNEYLASWDNEYLYLCLDKLGIYFIYFAEKQILIVFIKAT